MRHAHTPLGLLEKADGWAALDGVDHNVNTSIHYAEKLAGCRQFVHWALTPEGVVTRIKKDPLALLCQQEDCERCNQIWRKL